MIVFWVLYTIIARIYPNPYFGWPSQALGFAYGSIFAIFSDGLIRLFVEKIKWICGVCPILLGILGILYLQIHTPDHETEGMYFARIVMSLLMILIFLTFSVRINLRDRLMVYIGKISLYVYLLHGLVIDVLKNYLRDGLLILGSIIAAIFGAMCLSKILDLCMRLYKRNGNKGKI